MTRQTMTERLAAIEAEALGDEYATVTRIESAAMRAAASLTPAPPPSAPHPLDCGEITEDWITETIDVEVNQQRLERRHGVLQTLIQAARAKSTTLHVSAAPKILAGHQRELARLLAETAEVSDALGDVNTAAKAIAADAGHHWKQLTQLADDYQELRAAQLGHVSADVRHSTSPLVPGENHASDLYLANLDDLWPQWRHGGSDTQRIDLSRAAAAHRYEPWPIDPAELMLWLVRSKAQPWIPSIRDLQQLGQKRHARANPMPKVTPAQPEKPRNIIRLGA